MKKRKSILRKVTALAAVISLLVCMAGCSKDGSENSLEPITNRAEDGTYFDSGDTLCRGVWAADDGEKRVGYYVLYDRKSGKFADAQLGMEVPFNVKTNGSDAEFNLGAADFADPATVEKSGKGKRTLTWVNENRVEYLTLLSEQEPDAFTFYSQNDLSEMAMDYYENQKGSRPETADIVIGTDGMAAIGLISKVSKNGSVIAEYEIDTITGKGRVKDTDEEVILTKDDSEE